MPDIILAPEELMAQSAEMASLQADYESLLAQVTNVLRGFNDNWSPNLASNFEGKILGAQKSFSNIANMLANGSGAARLSSATFAGNLNSYLSALMGDENGDLGKLIGGLDGNAAQWAAHMLGYGAEYDSVKDVVGMVQSGDYEGALRAVGELGLDKLTGVMAGGLEDSEWVNQLDDATGGLLGLGNLKQQYSKNWIGDTFDNAVDAYQMMDSDPYGCLHKIGEAAWNMTAGAPLKTAGEAAWNVVENVPFLNEWYAEHGATDATSALGAIMGEIAQGVTGNKADADYIRNYYGDHGGVASGIVDGVVNIAQYAGEKLSSIPWNSLFM